MRTIFHIDVNSAYLSWEAVFRLQHGATIDLRKIPSVIAGNPKARRGIILAKSIPAKKYNIQTGESLQVAFQKCPILEAFSPTYGLYMKSSQALVNLLKTYSPSIQRFSIDECFLEYTHMHSLYKDPLQLALEIKNRIKSELGFTVNIGISNNKLLAKIASDFSKPDQVHTLYPDELAQKLWPLPVEDLFMIGRSTTPKLHTMGIYTIGDLANSDVEMLKHNLKSHGQLIHQYANGIEDSLLTESHFPKVKGIGNSTTIPFDVIDRHTALLYILSLTEMVGMRLRETECLCGLVSISIKTSAFKVSSHQKKLFYYTDLTNDIYHEACKLFDTLWDGSAIRHIGIRVSEFIPNHSRQFSFWEPKNHDALRTLDSTIDALRKRFGPEIISRAAFTNQPLKGISGGVPDHDDYPMMASTL